MASHLTITTTTAGVSSSRAFGTAEPAADGAVNDVFAALLGTAAPQAGGDTARSSSGSVDYNLANLVNLSLGFGEGGSEQSEDPEAVAALIDVAVPIQDTFDAAPVLTEIADSLATIKAALEEGELPDPETLRQLEAALTRLAEALDIDLDALPSLDDLTALVTDLKPDDTGFAARLTAAFGPVAEQLFSGSATAEVDPGVELSTLIKSVGDKLAALLTALNSGEIKPELLSQFDASAQMDTDLDAALAKLLSPAPTVTTVEVEPVLAAPVLKLTEPALTGKATEPAITAEAKPAAPTETPEAPAPVQASPDQQDRDHSDRSGDTDRRQAEPRPVATTTPVDKQLEPQQAQQPTTPAARVDLVAAPRVVQAGYQTSQQQLNLPQLAFELVRQVSDGNTRFQIRLDPAELGKIDVRLDIDKSGQVNARLTVEKAETLDLMQRDQKGLERALQQAGLDGAKTNLEFSLKQNNGGQGNQDGNGRNPIFGDDIAADADAPLPTINLYRGSLSASGVNIIA